MLLTLLFFLGAGDSTYAECCSGVQALLACLCLHRKRTVDLRPACTSVLELFDVELRNLARFRS